MYAKIYLKKGLQFCLLWGIITIVETRYSSLAQSVEHAAVNRSVVGSSPTGGARKKHAQACFFQLNPHLRVGEICFAGGNQSRRLVGGFNFTERETLDFT